MKFGFLGILLTNGLFYQQYQYKNLKYAEKQRNNEY